MKHKKSFTELQEFLFKKKHDQLGEKTLFTFLRDATRILLTHKKSRFFYKGDINKLPLDEMHKKTYRIGRLFSLCINPTRLITRKTLYKYKKEILFAIQYKLKDDHKLPPEDSAVLEQEFSELFDTFHGYTIFSEISTKETSTMEVRI